MLPERIKSYLDYCLLTNATLQKSLALDGVILYNYANAARDREYVAGWLKDCDNQVAFADAYIRSINKKEEVKAPSFVADVIEDYKRKGKGLYDLTVLTTNSDYNNWFLDDNDNQTAADKFELVAEAWVNGCEKGKIKIPAFVADWFEKAKKRKNITEIYYAIRIDEIPVRIKNWLHGGTGSYCDRVNNTRLNLLARAYLDGYEIEKEKRYIVSLPGHTNKGVLNYDLLDDEWCFSNSEETDRFDTKHTKEALVNAGFGWMFDAGFAKEVED